MNPQIQLILGYIIIAICAMGGIYGGYLVTDGYVRKREQKTESKPKEKPIVFLNNATISPILVNGKQNLEQFKISFELKNIGDKEITINKNKVYVVDLKNHKYKKIEEEINPQTLYPDGPAISPFLVGYSKEMLKTYHYFILIIEDNNDKGEYFFRKIQKLKALPSTYDMNLLAVSKKEEELLKNMLIYLINEGIEQSKFLKENLKI